MIFDSGGVGGGGGGEICTKTSTLTLAASLLVFKFLSLPCSLLTYLLTYLLYLPTYIHTYLLNPFKLQLVLLFCFLYGQTFQLVTVLYVLY